MLDAAAGRAAGLDFDSRSGCPLKQLPPELSHSVGSLALWAKDRLWLEGSEGIVRSPLRLVQRGRIPIRRRMAFSISTSTKTEDPVRKIQPQVAASSGAVWNRVCIGLA